MPRIQIELPKHFDFHTDLAIYQGHLNEAGHLDNAQLLTLVSEARQRYFASLGYTQTAVEGVGTLVSDAAVQYRSEAFHGEILRFEVQAHDFNRYGCDLAWRASVQADQTEQDESEREVARGKTGIVFYDYAARCVVPVPAGFRARVDNAWTAGPQ